MKLIIFSTRKYDIEFFKRENLKHNLDLEFIEHALDEKSTCHVDTGAVVCCFIHDDISRKVLKKLSEKNVGLIVLRCAGFNNVDLNAAKEFGIKVMRVPAYSPYAIAEHAVGLMLTLNRKTHRAYNRTRENNFTIDDLLGFDIHSKTVGIIGLGNIGQCLAKILNGFGSRVIAYDPFIEKLDNVELLNLNEVFALSDIISLHCPLNKETHHMINTNTIQLMKEGVMLINTSRGAVIDTKSVIAGLKTKKIGYLGLDVYEEEDSLFHKDLSNQGLEDEVLSRLLSFPNVLITSHQAFFTKDALQSIAKTTFLNVLAFKNGEELINEVKP